MTDVYLLPAYQQAQLIRKRSISAAELLDAHLGQFTRHHESINAVIVARLEQAQIRAQAADEALGRGEWWGPFHGVPMTIKESFDWVGTPSTWGIPEHRENFPSVYAAAERRMQGAGAILYGKTNVPRLLADWQSFNAIYGTTNNPWDTARTPGGSSGGSAAALATGMSSIEVGSDIGASIRNPAHYCGVFGHKPTFGIVSAAGQALPGVYAGLDIAVCGPLARSATDLRLAMAALAGAEGEESVGWSLALPDTPYRQLSDFRVGVLLQSPVCAQDQEMTEALDAAIAALCANGLTVIDDARVGFDLAACQHIYLTLLRAATGTRVDDATVSMHREQAGQRSPDDRSYHAYVDRGVSISHRDWWQLDNERAQMRSAWAAFFADVDLLLCPAAASAAFVHDQVGDRADRTITVNDRQEPTTDQLFWAGLSGVSYLPSTVAPIGLTRSGLPCGLQIVAPYLEDYRAIEFARLVEETLGGFAAPPMLS
ncbi:MAG: amidase [Pseudomonadota bacterium]